MTASKRLCVFCGSTSPSDPRYGDAAMRLGTRLGEAGIELVYGGGRVGLMGLIADAALAAGARVIGVIPAALHDREVAHPGLQQLVVVRDMHERKRQMFELCDAVAILPGGLGTLDEAFEAITLRQLGFIAKPVVVLNLDGYWTPLFGLIDHVVATGFARPQTSTIIQTVTRADDVIPACFGDAPRL
jgi:uncharacterized protein (TIGR00730 family)